MVSSASLGLNSKRAALIVMLAVGPVTGCKTLDIGGIDDVPSAAMTHGPRHADSSKAAGTVAGDHARPRELSADEVLAAQRAERELQLTYNILSDTRTRVMAPAAPLPARGMYPRASELYADAVRVYDAGSFAQAYELAAAAGDAGGAIDHTLRAGNSVGQVVRSGKGAHVSSGRQPSAQLTATLTGAQTRLAGAPQGEGQRAKMYRQAGMMLLKDAQKAALSRDYARASELAQAAALLSLIPPRLDRVGTGDPGADVAASFAGQALAGKKSAANGAAWPALAAPPGLTH